MKNKLLLFVFLILTIYVKSQNRVYVQDERLTPREHNVDMTHLLLDVKFEPEIGSERNYLLDN